MADKERCRTSPRNAGPDRAQGAGNDGAAARVRLASRLEQVAEHPLMLNQGTLYPALVRLEQRGWIKGTWRQTESRRDAKYYAITPGRTSRRRGAGRALAPAVGARQQAAARRRIGGAAHASLSRTPVEPAPRAAAGPRSRAVRSTRTWRCFRTPTRPAVCRRTPRGVPHGWPWGTSIMSRRSIATLDPFAGSKTRGRMPRTGFACCGAAPCSPRPRRCHWRSALARTPRSSRWPTPCSFVRPPALPIHPSSSSSARLVATAA